MRDHLLLLLIFPFLTACVSNPNIPNILERGFREQFDDRAGIIFLEGPWTAPKSEFGFQILGGMYRESSLSKDGKIETHVVAISNCEPLTEAINNLMSSVSKSANIVAGLEKADAPQVLVTDGYEFQLDIFSVPAWGSLSLSGGSTTVDILPWINASYKISEAAEGCLHG